LESFVLDYTKYANEYSNGERNFSGLKESPLFRINDGEYLVFNWNFLSNKLYNGLLFDFYLRSTISQEFPTFLAFKKYISESVIEKFIFRKLIEQSFRKKQTKVIFDNLVISGMPDAYVRDNKYIFLFEIKDAFFSSSTMSSLSYSKIKETIDQKYNTEKKGTGQIVKQLKHLINSSYEENSFEKMNIKRRNIVVYPIIIYTDSLFNLP